MELLKTQESNALKPFDATTMVVGENPYATKKPVKKVNENKEEVKEDGDDDDVNDDDDDEKEEKNENKKEQPLQGETKVNWALFSNEAEIEVDSEDEESDE
ncbi:hypothetical protein ACTFIU_006949 [Dictyostelium citrinum]